MPKKKQFQCSYNATDTIKFFESPSDSGVCIVQMRMPASAFGLKKPKWIRPDIALNKKDAKALGLLLLDFASNDL